ncbi:hypothetical protein ACO34A_24150 (plasmid) [Rhizobium sp. ACO-34A]|nr:putative quinol monooxygenase [Rhizobium sp. ACO-34A]ATN36872.1 hypothetical protein ACO34A_24150 [Rhizobium sp. ACO-34A]
MTPAISLVATIEVNPDSQSLAEAALLDCIPASRAEAGCLRYEVNRDRDHPGRYVFYEAWADPAALEAHVTAPHFQTMNARLAPVLVKDFEVTFLTPFG